MLQVQTLNFPRTVSSQHEFVPLTTVYPESSKVEYRGTCTYRKNKCSNERTFNIRGKIHSLCQKHRDLHNRNQRSLQYKRKLTRRYEMSRSLQNCHFLTLSMDNLMPTPSPEMKLFLSSESVEDVNYPSQWSVGEINAAYIRWRN